MPTEFFFSYPPKVEAKSLQPFSGYGRVILTKLFPEELQ